MKENNIAEVRLTQYSHGAGCGCKISPELLDSILAGVALSGMKYPNLLVGNAERDDAAVMDLGDGTAIVSTTDFFMPIVDDALTFGKIAAANAISDIYAMGGTPIMAIAILGWPVNKLPADLAGKIIEGAQMMCNEAKIPLAGGHSIDAPEPIFGLAVTGRISISHIKKNGGAIAGDILYLTKPLGTGILSTAQKKGTLKQEHEHLAPEVMMKLNSVGEHAGKMKGVHAMTDVTGFGLGGHLLEMCKASGITAILEFHLLPIIDSSVHEYIAAGNIPGGTERNFQSYGEEIYFEEPDHRWVVCDPQTSGGLLIAVGAEECREVEELLEANGLWASPIGRMEKRGEKLIEVML